MLFIVLVQIFLNFITLCVLLTFLILILSVEFKARTSKIIWILAWIFRWIFLAEIWFSWNIKNQRIYFFASVVWLKYFGFQQVISEVIFNEWCPTLKENKWMNLKDFILLDAGKVAARALIWALLILLDGGLLLCSRSVFPLVCSGKVGASGRLPEWIKTCLSPPTLSLCVSHRSPGVVL